jgi:hypothetical protein
MDNKQPVRFCFGTDDRYQALKNNNNLDPNAIYFIVDSSGGGRLYVGNQNYNIDIVDNLSIGPDSNTTVPSVYAVASGLNEKVSRCRIITDDTSTSVPALITLTPDTEFRYTALTGSSATTSITLSIPNALSYQYYSSIVLSKINSSSDITTFVTLDANSPTQTVRFLNPDFSLSGKDVVEILFFSNGLDICCIGAGYSVASP